MLGQHEVAGLFGFVNLLGLLDWGQLLLQFSTDAFAQRCGLLCHQLLDPGADGFFGEVTKQVRVCTGFNSG